MFVLNAFQTRTGSSFLHGIKFVFLTVSSCDVAVMSMGFLHVGASENVTF